MTALREDPVREIFDYWREVMAIQETTILTLHKRSIIQQRLDDGFMVEDLMKVIVNCHETAWNMGGNRDRILRNDIPFIFASVERVEMFLNQLPAKATIGMTLEEARSIDNIKRFVPPPDALDEC